MNTSPNPACWRSSDHKYAVNLGQVCLIECDEWEVTDPTPQALKELDSDGITVDVTLTFQWEATSEMSLLASDYWALLNAFEIYLSTR